MIQYNNYNYKFAKRMRKNMTPWELRLWGLCLRKLPLRFKRQHLLGTYIVDFYCAKAKLVVEIDGGQHYYDDDTQNKDAERDEFLKSQGLTILRFSDTHIHYFFESVCAEIYKAIEPYLNKEN